VQLISRETFRQIGATNWCLYEYEGYKKFMECLKKDHSHYYDNALKNNFFFFVVGQDLNSVKPGILVREYRQWYGEIENTLYLKFYSVKKDAVGNQATQDFEQFGENIKNLSLAIIQAKKRLIDNIPV
jgi:hypothetical protein